MDTMVKARKFIAETTNPDSTTQQFFILKIIFYLSIVL